jgi:hypothetical protein
MTKRPDNELKEVRELKEALRDHGIQLNVLAKRIGKHPNSVYRELRGEAKLSDRVRRTAARMIAEAKAGKEFPKSKFRTRPDQGIPLKEEVRQAGVTYREIAEAHKARSPRGCSTQYVSAVLNGKPGFELRKKFKQTVKEVLRRHKLSKEERLREAEAIAEKARAQLRDLGHWMRIDALLDHLKKEDRVDWEIRITKEEALTIHSVKELLRWARNKMREAHLPPPKASAEDQLVREMSEHLRKAYEKGEAAHLEAVQQLYELWKKAQAKGGGDDEE